MQMDGIPRKGASCKAQDVFQQHQLRDALEGTCASLKYLAQAAATVRRSREAPQQHHQQDTSYMELCINTKRYSNF